jgi:hypothetical protein
MLQANDGDMKASLRIFKENTFNYIKGTVSPNTTLVWLNEVGESTLSLEAKNIIIE